jgi:hypothetical protein
MSHNYHECSVMLVLTRNVNISKVLHLEDPTSIAH